MMDEPTICMLVRMGWYWIGSAVLVPLLVHEVCGSCLVVAFHVLL